MQILEPQQFATWNEPIDMLYACHSKVKRFCKQLTILPGYLEKNGVNQAVLNDVKTILQYFNHRHLALEEPLFELGKQYLSAEQLTAMGKIMFARRQA